MFVFQAYTCTFLNQSLKLTDGSMVNELGTAGVWRISAINEAGGWKDRTTVEDMDLAVRATLKGWKFLYVGDIRVCCFLSLFIMVNRNKTR